MSDYELRMFQEEINNVINAHPGLSWESRLLALQVATLQVEKLADKAVMKELEEVQNAESIYKDSLGKLPE